MMRRVFEHLATGDLDERTIARSGPLTLAPLHFSHIHLFTSHFSPSHLSPIPTTRRKVVWPTPHLSPFSSLTTSSVAPPLPTSALTCTLPSITKLVGVWQERQIFEKKVSHPSPLIIIEPER